MPLTPDTRRVLETPPELSRAPRDPSRTRTAPGHPALRVPLLPASQPPRLGRGLGLSPLRPGDPAPLSPAGAQALRAGPAWLSGARSAECAQLPPPACSQQGPSSENGEPKSCRAGCWAPGQAVASPHSDAHATPFGTECWVSCPGEKRARLVTQRVARLELWPSFLFFFLWGRGRGL